MITDDILRLLDDTGGNARAVADQLSVSYSYVHRVKREQWTPPEGSPNASELAVVPPQDRSPTVPQEAVLASIAPNYTAIQDLRDETIAQLRGKIKEAGIPITVLKDLLSMLLNYENKTQELLRPTLNLYDQRHQNQMNVFGDLVKEMAELQPAQLGELAGIKTIEVQAND